MGTEPKRVKMTVDDVEFLEISKASDSTKDESGGDGDGGDIYLNCYRSCVRAGGNPSHCWKYCYQGFQDG